MTCKRSKCVLWSPVYFSLLCSLFVCVCVCVQDLFPLEKIIKKTKEDGAAAEVWKKTYAMPFHSTSSIPLPPPSTPPFFLPFLPSPSSFDPILSLHSLPLPLALNWIWTPLPRPLLRDRVMTWTAATRWTSVWLPWPGGRSQRSVSACGGCTGPLVSCPLISVSL